MAHKHYSNGIEKPLVCCGLFYERGGWIVNLCIENYRMGETNVLKETWRRWVSSKRLPWISVAELSSASCLSNKVCISPSSCPLSLHHTRSIRKISNGINCWLNKGGRRLVLELFKIERNNTLLTSTYHFRCHHLLHVLLPSRWPWQWAFVHWS